MKQNKGYTDSATKQEQSDHHQCHRLSRRNFIELAGIAGLCLGASSLVGCSASNTSASTSSTANNSANLDITNWNSICSAAKGQSVSFYGWGGSEVRNQWLDTDVATALKEKYDITLKRVPMGIDDILTKLSGEIQAGKTEGSIDFIWINGENFFSAKQNGYLYGPFANQLPNYTAYINPNLPENQYDFGEPIDGYEAPYGKAQMECWVDTAKVGELPDTVDKFSAFVQAHPGQVTYPAPGDFTGTAFISCLIAGVIGKTAWEQLATITADKAKIKAIIDPGLAYLRSLNPYLWQKGATFPAASTTISQMFADGELLLNMGYGDPQPDMKKGLLPATVRPFVFQTGTVGNENFMAIAKNAPHKAAALIAINEIMSPELQLSQYADLTTISVLDMNKLSSDEKTAFDNVPLGAGSLPLDTLLNHRLAEANGNCIPLIEKIWTEEVVGK